MKRKTQYGGSLRRAVVALLAVVMLFSVCFPALRASAEDNIDGEQATSYGLTHKHDEDKKPGKEEEVTVTFEVKADAEKGIEAKTEQVTVTKNATLGDQLPTSPAAPGGYTFVGWYVDGDSTKEAASRDTTITSAVTYQAVFTAVASESDGSDGEETEDEESSDANAAESNDVYVYLYVQLNADDGVDISDWTKNNDGWYTVGCITVDETTLALSNSTQNAGGETVYVLSNNLDVLKAAIATTFEEYGKNPVTIDNIVSNVEWTDFKLCSGAVDYPDATQYAYHLDGTLTLTASNTYVLNYDGNVPEDETVTNVPDEQVAVSSESSYTFTISSETPVREGYVFTGWNTVADGSGTSYAAGDTITVTESETTLYAVWTVQTYTVTYTDGVEDEIVFADQVYSDLTAGTDTPAFDGDSTTEGNQEPTRDGYTFAGWSPAVEQTVTGNATYIATWEAVTIEPVPVDPIEPVEYETSKSKEATNLEKNSDGDYESTVTLSFPSSEQVLSTDVVFVLDKSTSQEVIDDALDLIDELLAQTKEESASVKVGVVTFYATASVQKSLTELSDSTVDEIKKAMQPEYQSGTNMHAGLLAGKAMLDADTDVDSSRKYLILVSDGISYYYCHGTDYNTAYTIALENNVGSAQYELSAWEVKYGQSYVPDWTSWLANAGGLANTDYSSYEFEVGTSYTDAISYANKDIYPINADLSLYYSYQVYQEISEQYHCYAVLAYTVSGTTWPFGPSFMSYLGSGSVSFDAIKNDILYLLDAGTSVVDEIGDSVDADGNLYDFDFVTDASTLSLKVGDTVYSAVSTGENTYGFGDPTNGIYPYELTYYPEGTVYKGTTYAECFVWTTNVAITNFARVQLSYKVVLTNPQTTAGEYGEYDRYGDVNNGSTDYGLYTNNSATLYPVDSNGTEGDPDPFQMPTVSYAVEETTEPTETDPTDPTTTDPTTETEEEVTYFDLTVKKVWKDNHNSGSTRPSSVTVRIYCDGVKYEDVELSSDNSWKVTLDDLEEDHVWSYVELNVPSGYKASISLSGNTLTVTNTLKTTYTSSDTLLQTGQLNWPIPVLTVLGLALMGVGCAMIIVKKKGRYES